MSSNHRARKRIALTILPLVVGALALTGCGRSSGGDSASAQSVDDKPAKGTIEFWAGGADGKAVPELLKDFEAQNPGVKVNVTNIPEDQVDTKLTTAITSGNVPDLVFLYSQTQAAMFDTKGFAEVPSGLVDPGAFFTAAYDSTLFDGKHYAVPWYASANVLTYRKDLASSAGAEAPTSWDGLVDFAKTMKASGIEHPLSLSVSYDTYTAQELDTYVHDNGGSLISKDLKTWTLNSAKNVEALQFWGSLFAKGYASPDGPGFLDTVPDFTSGKTAALSTGPFFPVWLTQANGASWNGSHTGYALLPAGAAGSHSPISGGSLAVPKDAKNPDAAWKLVRWMSEPKVQAKWYKIFGNLPAVKSGWDDLSSTSGGGLDVQKKAIDTGFYTPQVPGWSQVSAVLGKAMEGVARGTLTARQALDQAQQQAESIGTGIK